MENIGEKRMDMISKWEEKSRDFIDAFLLLFGREGRLVCTCMRTRISSLSLKNFFFLMKVKEIIKYTHPLRKKQDC